MPCDKRVVFQPSITEAVVIDDHPTVKFAQETPLVVRTGNANKPVIVSEKTNIVVEKTQKSVISIGTPGPKGPQGPPGPAGGESMRRISDAPLGGQRIVRATGAETVNYADNTQPGQGDDVLGLTVTATGGAGAEIFVVNGAEVIDPSWSWTPLEPLYLGQNGLMTQVPPPDAAAFTLVVGFATSATSVMIRIEHPVYH